MAKRCWRRSSSNTGTRLVIFTFKETARKLFGSFAGNGFVPGINLAHSEVFVMPGPYESANTARRTLSELGAYFQ